MAQWGLLDQKEAISNKLISTPRMKESMSPTITSVVAHIDHGKTSLIDSLVASQGRISKTLAGSLRFLDTREDERTRGITLKLSAITLENNGRKHVFIDTPGHVDFESLIQTSSILSDGFLVLIDVNEGITPRTYSLVNYTKGKCCVLAVNKIDKISSESELLQKTLSVISSLNALIGKDMFAWEQNNVILCCATLCYGISYRLFLKVLGRVGSLRNAIGFMFHLYKRIDENEIEKICANFSITAKSRKSILSTVLPLADCVFASVEDNSGTTESLAISSPLLHDKDISFDKEDNSMMSFFSSEVIGLRSISSGRAASLVGVTVYGMLRTPGKYLKEELLFVTRLFRGSVSVGDVVYCADSKRIEECVIRAIYVFGINELIEVRSAKGSNLVCLGGDFQKNSLITDVPTHWIDIESKITPFYKFKLSLDDMEQLDELKEVFRIMSCTEQFLKVKLNKYGEITVLCTGKVQFEKITADLTEIGFRYSVVGFEDLFCEYATESCCGNFAIETLSLKLHVSKAENCETQDSRTMEEGEGFRAFREWEDSNKNQFVLVSGLCSEVIENVLEILVCSGPLIRERIHETRFLFDVKGEVGSIALDLLYGFFRTSVTSVYLRCSPSVAPMFYECSISVQEEFIGEIYKSLTKCNYVARGEEYEERTGFYIISILIPQFLYDGFLEDVRVKTKGTAYILLKEAGYICILDFSRYVGEIRKKKGLFVEEKIVEEASKQRTHKKQ